MKYLVLLRGVNVGGKNKVSMTELKSVLAKAGLSNVSTYINSGNVLLESEQPATAVAQKVESIITQNFALDSELIKTVALSAKNLETIVSHAPDGFGSQPDTYHSDVLFPMDDVTADDVMGVISLNPEVDAAWTQNGVVYFQRVSALRTRSRLSRIIESPVYKSTTIRSWNTTVKLFALLQK